MLNSTVYWANQLWKTLPDKTKNCFTTVFYKQDQKLGTVIDVVSVQFVHGTLPM